MTIPPNKDTPSNVRITVTDGLITSHLSEDHLPEEWSPENIARVYARDHNPRGDTYVVLSIEDLSDLHRTPFVFALAVILSGPQPTEHQIVVLSDWCRVYPRTVPRWLAGTDTTPPSPS